MAGGIGAALGVFISDMMIHGNPLLSLLVGVTSKLIGFYILAWIGRKEVTKFQMISGLAVGCVLGISSHWLYTIELLDFTTAMLFVGVCLFSVTATLIIHVLWLKWRSYGIGSIIGLGVGSAIIGIGVWWFSQYFILPSGEFQMPLYTSVIWFLWTFCTEIPFLVVLVPPILKACYKAFPNLKPELEKQQ